MLLWILLGFVSLSFLIYFLQILTLRKKLAEKTYSNFTPSVSIIKPLKGVDDSLFENIENFCKQNYPEYEVILSVEDSNDPAYKVANEIKNKYPDKVTIVVDNSSHALNPKVRNMITAYKVSKHEYFLISDSNISVDPEYLKETVASMTPDTGLVTNLIVGVGGKSIGSVLENLHLNSFILLSVCFLDKFLKMPCSIGKSMLMKKKDFEDVGGFEAIQDTLAEDYLIGKLIHEKGKIVAISKYMIKNVNEYWSIKRFLERHTRWAKIRWKLAQAKYFTEPLVNPTLIACFLPLLCGFSKLTLLLFLSVVSIKIAGDLLVMRMIKQKPKISLFLVPIKDLIIGVLWLVPFVTSKVNWRGNLYIISKNTKLMLYKNSLWKQILLKLKTKVTKVH